MVTPEQAEAWEETIALVRIAIRDGFDIANAHTREPNAFIAAVICQAAADECLRQATDRSGPELDQAELALALTRATGNAIAEYRDEYGPGEALPNELPPTPGNPS